MICRSEFICKARISYHTAADSSEYLFLVLTSSAFLPFSRPTETGGSALQPFHSSRRPRVLCPTCSP